MYVNIGNSNAIEGFRDPTSDDPDLVRYRPAEGDRTTYVEFPEGIALSEAFQTLTGLLKAHMAEGSVPAWVESDSDGLTALLKEHWGLDDNQTTRPDGWGDDADTEGDDA